MSIAAEFSIGNILTIVTLIVGSVVFLTRFRTDIQILVTRIELFDRELTGIRVEMQKFGGALVEMAKQATRLDHVDKRLDDTIASRHQMQADAHARFEGLEARLRVVEARWHEKREGRPSNVVAVIPEKKRARGRG